MRLPLATIMPILATFIACSSVVAAEQPSEGLVFAAEERFPKHIPLDGPAVVIPCVSARDASRGDVLLLFRNVSQKPFRYIEGSRKGDVAFLHFVLYTNGEPVPTLFTLVPPVISEDRVRTLAPGEYVTYRFSLRDRYGVDREQGNLPSGTYELRAEYDIREGTDRHSVGCTPQQINRTIMLIELGNGSAAAARTSPSTLIIVAASLLALILLARPVLLRGSRKTVSRSGTTLVRYGTPAHGMME